MMIELQTAIAATQAIIQLAQRAREVGKKLENVELQNLMADLIGSVAELKVQLAELREEKAQMADELSNLRRQQDFRTRVSRRGNFYYLGNPLPAGYSGGPYCMACMDTKSALVTCIQNPNERGMYAQCPECKTGYYEGRPI